jgi:hypothetical protein
VSSPTYRILTADELAVIKALRENVRPDCNDGKRIQRMANWKRVSEKGEQDLLWLAHKYRRQLVGFPKLPLPRINETKAIHDAGYRTMGEAAK